MESQKWLKQLVVAVLFVSGLMLNVGVMKSSAETIGKDENIESMESNYFSTPVVSAEEAETISKDENIESMESNYFSIPVVSAEEAENGYMNDGTELPDEFIVNSNENANPLLRSATLGTEEWTKVSTTREISNGFIAWHPGWSEYQYNISYYYFSKSTMSFSASIGYGFFSISVAKAGSNGQAIKADPQKWTRPGIYGNVDVTKYNVKKYNGAGIYTGSTTKYASKASSTYVKSRNK
ncbi:hypothetical protein ACQKNC_21630 [Lysinibacillus sp. NPDC094177]|uniref:hypothetical protein n=1 Tax=Lysinibacillus sp. NPDC094177 TaxID=3390580 RepID=UPI003D020EEB